MTVRVGINGFGRIGRNFLRAVLDRGSDLDRGTDLSVVALNDITDPHTNAHLLRYDSTHGRLGSEVRVTGSALVVGDQRIRVFAERDPTQIPWDEAEVSVVVESTGRFTSRDAAAVHLARGVDRVVISAPSKDADLVIVVGVNDDLFDPARHRVVSNASCTTNCFVPMAKVLDDAFGVVGGLMTTVHAYTNDQNLLDLAHRDLRRARAAAVNVVPASTGAARSTGQVLPALKGRLDGLAFRVPVPVGSITDFTAVVREVVTVEAVNAAFARAAEVPPLAGIVVYSEEPLVSTDIVGSPASCTFDSGLTMVLPVGSDRTMVKVQGWYDNEWGYSNRLLDAVAIVGAAGGAA